MRGEKPAEETHIVGVNYKKKIKQKLKMLKDKNKNLLIEIDKLNQKLKRNITNIKKKENQLMKETMV